MKATGKVSSEQPKSLADRRRKTLTVSWDTCVFLAWLKNEVRQPGEMEGVEAIAKQIEKGEITLATSALTKGEIFQGRLSNTERAKMQKFFQRSNVYVLPFDSGVADVVSEIREFYADSDFELLTPDAIHIATAIHYEVDEFQTFDGSDVTKKPRDKGKKRCGLLALTGSIAGKYSLKISKPEAIQLDLLRNLSDTISVGTDDVRAKAVGK